MSELEQAGRAGPTPSPIGSGAGDAVVTVPAATPRTPELSPQVRASDAEREATVERLSAACAEGRLTLEELSNRVGSAYAAVLRSELEPLVVDLPVPGTAPPVVTAAPAPAARRERLVCVMSSLRRRGHWRLPSQASVITVMGEAELDLREAVIDSPEIELRCVVVMGEQRITVPKGVEVDVSGMMLMGERHVDVDPVRPRPGRPRLRIHVSGAMGAVRVISR